MHRKHKTMVVRHISDIRMKACVGTSRHSFLHKVCGVGLKKALLLYKMHEPQQFVFYRNFALLNRKCHGQVACLRGQACPSLASLVLQEPEG